MEFESIHHSALCFSFLSTAAVYQPVDFNSCKVIKPLQEVRNGCILDGDDKLVQVDKRYPMRVITIGFQAIIIGGQLSPVTRPILIFHYPLTDVGLKNGFGIIGALVVVDIEFFHSLLPMPFNPFLEIRAFILGYCAD